MSKKISTPLTIAIGTALVGGLTAAGSVSAKVVADGNPFGMEELQSGYLITGDKEGSCGEGKCGEDKDKGGEGACGEDKDKGGEGACGEDKDKAGEGACGGS
jgi:uncharacterized low-complexity protein